MKFTLPKNFYFLIPIIGAIPWGGMLIAMLVSWSIQGHPIYWFVDYPDQFPLYISFIGATNLQPLFISGSAWQGVLFVNSLITELYLRKTGKLQYWFKRRECNFLITAIILASIGQVGIILCSIFDTVKYPKLHHAMLGVFFLFILMSMVCIMFQYLSMGLNYRKIHVNNKYWNKFTISFYLKLLWSVFALICAICFEALPNKSISSCFEWTLAFWYLLLFIIFSWDLSSSAKHKHKNYPHIKDWTKFNFYLYEINFASDSIDEESVC